MTRLESQNEKGFSIPEIVIVITFFTIMSSLVLFNYRNFDDQVQLSNVTLDVALTMRDMQVRALSSRDITSAQTPEARRNAYGVHVDVVGSNTSFVSYVNRDTANPEYFWFDGTCPSSIECLTQHPLPSGYTISDVCSNDTCGGNTVSISFLRPNLDAIIRTANGGSSVDNRGSARIEIMAPSGATSSVHVTKTGLIYVQ